MFQVLAKGQITAINNGEIEAKMPRELLGFCLGVNLFLKTLLRVCCFGLLRSPV